MRQGGFLFAALSIGMTCAATEVRAAGFDFVRMVQTERVGSGDVTTSYGAEAQRSLGVAEKSAASTGPTAGSETERQYRGLQHRLLGYYGLTNRVELGVEQVFTQPDAATFDLGLLVPEVRLKVVDGAGPVAVGLFANARIRHDRRRPSTGTIGATAERTFERTAYASSLGFEGRPSSDGEYGLRYSLGIGHRMGSRVFTGAEAWGAAIWFGERFEQDHHGGPTVRFALGERAWCGLNYAVGVNQRPQRIYVDHSVMVKVGLAL